MKCADCKTMHHGIEGLIPARVAARIRGMKSYDMICGACETIRREARGKYQAASQGE